MPIDEKYDNVVDPRKISKTEILLALSIRNKDVEARKKYGNWNTNNDENYVPGKEILDWIQIITFSNITKFGIEVQLIIKT